MGFRSNQFNNWSGGGICTRTHNSHTQRQTHTQHLSSLQLKFAIMFNSESIANLLDTLIGLKGANSLVSFDSVSPALCLSHLWFFLNLSRSFACSLAHIMHDCAFCPVKSMCTLNCVLMVQTRQHFVLSFCVFFSLLLLHFLCCCCLSAMHEQSLWWWRLLPVWRHESIMNETKHNNKNKQKKI